MGVGRQLDKNFTVMTNYRFRIPPEEFLQKPKMVDRYRQLQEEILQEFYDDIRNDKSRINPTNENSPSRAEETKPVMTQSIASALGVSAPMNFFKAQKTGLPNIFVASTLNDSNMGIP